MYRLCESLEGTIDLIFESFSCEELAVRRIRLEFNLISSCSSLIFSVGVGVKFNPFT